MVAKPSHIAAPAPVAGGVFTGLPDIHHQGILAVDEHGCLGGGYATTALEGREYEQRAAYGGERCPVPVLLDEFH